MSMLIRYLFRFVCLAVLAGQAWAIEPLPALNIERDSITVSGISSGAFMAVQFGVAHSAAVSGIAATAGGPYFCAGQDAWAGAAVGKAIGRCMQGDPAYPLRPIDTSELAAMTAAARAWAARGLIDPLSNLSHQRIWLFHGYNDGVVRQEVGAALRLWFAQFVPANQLFVRDDLPAGHAQISLRCAGATCQPCTRTGGDFINRCADDDGTAYDAAGAALQFFYGALEKPVAAGELQIFDQRPYVQREERSVVPLTVAMGEQGYLYVPAACASGEACRLHIAFHGCQQSAGALGDAFARRAGFNEWAASNRIVVLYPQAAATVAFPGTPLNPQGCWDWWGYNDFGWSMTGHYATRDGEQIAAVWRMVLRLTAGNTAAAAAPLNDEAFLHVVDRADDQVLLAWRPRADLRNYRLYRDGQLVADFGDLGNTNAWVDGGRQPQTRYRYALVGVADDGSEIALGEPVVVRTSRSPPACDPHFSLAKGVPVDRKNRPTRHICP